MKKLFIYLKNNPNKFLSKLIILFIFIVIFTCSDLIVKQIAFLKLKEKPDVVVIPGFWQYHYQINDDIGFSILRGFDKYFSTPKKIKKEVFESKILDKLDNDFYREAITGYYRIRDNNNEYYELQEDISDYDIEVIKDIFISVDYRTSKWLFIISLQGFATLIIIIFFFYSHLWKYLIPLGLIISGALGNFLDRIIRGYVVDYVMWTFKFPPFNFLNKITNNLFNPWPIFNLADVYTITGAIILFVIVLFFSKEDEKEKQTKDTQEKKSDTNNFEEKIEEVKI